ncbi:hypothetical protein D7X74_37925 [Corallococcus sp. CA047B]|uniref:hypothetical protein n=1 Tax=Corallococcus sp. CA047B TaxID=2316729 RepID=UPI000EA0A0DC|nr:hypothetical protein [Corallococcus sp. CA047B]RKH01363.1 hypothetical protein D7X74_37925 [Corallococcus sp. CA047B]
MRAHPVRTVCLLLLLCSLGPPSAWAAQAPEAPWAIILGQDAKRPTVAKLLAAQKKARALAWVKPAKGFPKLVASKSLPGLPEGQHVLLLGVCGTKAEAQAARALVRPMVPDVAVQQLTGTAALACPAPNALKAELPADAKAEGTFAFPDAPGLELTVHRVAPSPALACPATDLLLRVVQGDAVLARHVMKGQCAGACNPQEQEAAKARVASLQEKARQGDTMAEMMLKNVSVDCQARQTHFKTVLTELGAPVAVVAQEPAMNSRMPDVGMLVGPGCGKLIVSPYLSGETGAQDLSKVLAKADAEGPEGWKAFSVFVPGRDPTAQAERRHLGHFVWIAPKCEWVTDDEEGQDM